MEAIKLCRLDTPIIFIEARINLSRFFVTGCAAFFFFQAEDGIRDGHVTGVQTCALPIFGEQTLFDHEPAQHAYLDYRRWAFESAALDLTLRQNGMSLGEAVGRKPTPVTFVVSGGLGEPPTTERVRGILANHPELK